jgi:hypothetical protein
MSMLKFDYDKPSHLHLEHSDLRAHYQTAATRALSSIRRDWRVIAALVALTLLLACAIIPLMPRQYSATALVYPKLYSAELGRLAPMGSVDAASLVTSEARLIVSDAVLQGAVKRLGLHPDFEAGGSGSWTSTGLDWIRDMLLPETRNYSLFDGRVAMLRNKVEVMRDTRSYLIALSFTARSPDEAAKVVNAIALQYVKDKELDRRQSMVAAAELELSRQLANYGERHPKVLQLADEVDSARAALKEAPSTEGAHDSIVTGESVKLAIPNRTPTSPKGFVILGMSFMLSLLAGISLAVWCDRRGLESRGFLLGLLPPARRFAEDRIAGLVAGARSATLLFETPLLRRLRVDGASLGQRLGLTSLGQRALQRFKSGHPQEPVALIEGEQPILLDGNEVDAGVCRVGAADNSSPTTPAGAGRFRA